MWRFIIRLILIEAKMWRKSDVDTDILSVLAKIDRLDLLFVLFGVEHQRSNEFLYVKFNLPYLAPFGHSHLQ